MKLSIRFADQIVGALIILALTILVLVVFMLGRSQRWFSRDFQYKSYFTSAAGVSRNMAVQYKGFTIGHIKQIKLTEDDRVEVDFTIFDIYNDRVKEGSLVEVQVSPIGLGNQFLFYAGMGTEQIPEGGVIPSLNSPEGRKIVAMGMTMLPDRDDSISNIMALVSSVMTTLDMTLADLQEAIEGTDRTSLGRTLGSVEEAASGLSALPADLEKILTDLVSQFDPILKNFHILSDQLAEPSGTVMSVLDSEGPLYTDLIASLDSVSGILRNLEKTSDFIPAQLPQIAAIIADLHTALRTAEDVLVSLTNNPLLKGGVPQRKETYPGGARPRDLEF